MHAVFNKYKMERQDIYLRTQLEAEHAHCQDEVWSRADSSASNVAHRSDARNHCPSHLGLPLTSTV
eukprot:5816540-Pleurochrysis_carterae.AAC.1